VCRQCQRNAAVFQQKSLWALKDGPCIIMKVISELGKGTGLVVLWCRKWKQEPGPEQHWTPMRPPEGADSAEARCQQLINWQWIIEASVCSVDGGSETLSFSHCPDPREPQPLPARLSVDVTAKRVVSLRCIHHFQPVERCRY
jgi:hypothetical protein